MNKNKTIAIVVPSYREFKNIPVLITGIRKILPESKIIIVDDSPKDENLKLKILLEKEKNIKLVSRLKKLGRGSAVLAGFKEALKDKNIKYVFEMDSDLAHSPKEFGRYLLKLNEKKYDLIIGSRYLKGARTIGISFKRKVLSVFVNRFLHFWLNVKISDFTGGFRLYSRRSVEYLTSIELKAKGFIALSEIAYRLTRNGFSIGEVPITINNVRKFGASTVDSNELIKSLAFILKMRGRDLVLQISWKLIFSIVFIFLLAFILRINTLNQIGRTWDEQEYVEQGYEMVELIKKGDFGNSFFYTTYDHPPLVKYLYGITAHFDVERVLKNTEPVFRYDYTFSRILSAVMFSVGVLFTVLIGWKLFSPTVGIIAGIILSMLPFSLGLSQLVAAESLKILTYPLAIYFYIFLLRNRIKTADIIFAGIATGLALQAKQTNFILIALLAIIFLIQYKRLGKIDRRNFLQEKLKISLIVCLVSVLVFIALWPQLVFHIRDVWYINQKVWSVHFSPKIWQITLAPPEVFFGKLRLVPIFYYVVYFFISIPVLILILFFLGFRKILTNKNIYSLLIALWFLLPFGLSVYSWRQHGLRYIVEIYPAIALIAALGFDTFIQRFTRNQFSKLLYFIPVIVYLLLSLWYIKPYYLDYFNELVGGTGTVYKYNLFQMGWWGQGEREAGLYLRKNAFQGSDVGLALSPEHTFPRFDNLKYSIWSANKKYDFIVVNHYHIIRDGFDDSIIRKNYNLAYRVKADGATLVYVYKKK
ncbi:glycosyltransferase [Patescibacteria group bacterium]|nr:glycosyltransferase [Patescibacteria group bacterium]